MTIHYHGTPITPRETLYELTGRHFCVSYADPRDVEVVHKIGQSVMLDNGAYTQWRLGKTVDWEAYRSWALTWLRHKSSWAVIPDVIGGAELENDCLINAYPESPQWAPVWHMHERLIRLDNLCYAFDRVCIGSSGDFDQVGSAAWHRRMIEVMNLVCRHGEPPCWLHMMRGMSLAGSHYPFASLDSTDIARHHHEIGNSAHAMAHRWDAQQCPGRWIRRPEQMDVFSEVEA